MTPAAFTHLAHPPAGRIARRAAAAPSRTSTPRSPSPPPPLWW
eukprot:CAMPEP_0181356194 /NCGR_PEP_ID=MMETSP1106-20121128/4294_1 /TAXON_ID=81844 /ORGANISM="Mantoniella antarctica, Strain SL-175" /LENGTH=42 /DNA_ID= /DNA_START= /DNA_END= /DNA_ORIENTATION=